MAANVDNNATDSTPIERVHAPKVLLTKSFRHRHHTSSVSVAFGKLTAARARSEDAARRVIGLLSTSSETVRFTGVSSRGTP